MNERQAKRAPAVVVRTSRDPGPNPNDVGLNPTWVQNLPKDSHAFGFLNPFFFIQFARVPGVVLQRFAMNLCVDPFASSASISGRNGSSLLLPVPFGRPSGFPATFLALSASLVLAESRSRSISAAIENAMAMIRLWIVSSSLQDPLIA